MSDERGLLPEDRTEIKVVDAAVRDVWFWRARPEYLCPTCGRWHRSWSKIGQAHDPRKRTP